jgi:hypothetical protein
MMFEIDNEIIDEMVTYFEEGEMKLSCISLKSIKFITKIMNLAISNINNVILRNESPIDMDFANSPINCKFNKQMGLSYYIKNLESSNPIIHLLEEDYFDKIKINLSDEFYFKKMKNIELMFVVIDPIIYQYETKIFLYLLYSI